MLTVRELSSEQLEELKWNEFWGNPRWEKFGDDFLWDNIPDDYIFDKYSNTIFSPDDFSCTAGQY